MEIILYGRGFQARKLVETINPNIDILAVTDSFVDQKENDFTFLGIPIILHRDIQKKKFDYVIIGTLKDNEMIKKTLLNDGIKENKIMTLSEFYVTLYREYYHNNDLWDFYINHYHRGINKMLHYFDIYEHWLEKFRNKDIVMMEIGVAEGGSLQMWKNYFGSKAVIIGVDVDSKCKEYEEEQIYVEIGSQEEPEFWNYIKNKYPKIDILLDDGGHTMRQQIITYEEMFSHIQNGGIYICEDLHTSYMDYYGGGLKKINSYIEYSKDFIDDINAYHIQEKENNYNTQNIAGIHYYDSLIVIEKEVRKCAPFSVNIDCTGGDI